MIENIYDATLALIKSEIETDYKHDRIAHYEMMKHLICLYGEKEWNGYIQYLFDWVKENSEEDTSFDDRFGMFFYAFHKHFRQVDAYNLQFSYEIRKMDDEKKKFWREYAEKHDASLKVRKVGRNEFEREEWTIHYHHHGGHLDMLFWQLIHATDRVEWIMEQLFLINDKGLKDFDAYFWSDVPCEFRDSKRKERLTE